MQTWEQYWAAYRRLRSIKAVAREFGVNERTVGRSISRAKRRGEISELIDDDAGIQAALASTGLQPETALLGWRKVKQEDGSFNTVMWKMPQPETDPGELVAAIKAGLEDIEPVAEIPRPSRVSDELCNVWPFFDVHWGMHAWRKETLGADYDLKLAHQDMMDAVERLIWVVPHAKKALVIFGGDTMHVDDSRNETPASGHKLDADGRYWKMITELVTTIRRVILRIGAFHDEITVRFMRGNHDPHAHMAIALGLMGYFGNHPIRILPCEADLFMEQWGNCGIFAHHGDRIAKPEELALKLADVCPFWSSVRHRHAYTGHMHKMEAKRIGGLNWERVEPFAPADGYGSSWVNRRLLKVDTYHIQRGRVATAYDHIERAA
jgi:hypothetical protein